MSTRSYNALSAEPPAASAQNFKLTPYCSARIFGSHVSMDGCQAPGFVQRPAVNPARSGRKQR